MPSTTIQLNLYATNEQFMAMPDAEKAKQIASDMTDIAKVAKTVVVPSGKYFGKYYQDIQKRVPSIANAKKRLGWAPKVGLKKAIKLTLDYHLAHKDYQLE